METRLKIKTYLNLDWERNMANLINNAFQNARNQRRPALITYTVAGDNTKKKSLEILKSISRYVDTVDKYKPALIGQLKTV